MNKLNYKKAKSLVERAIKEKGRDFVYERNEDDGCVYFNPEGQPSCIVGYVLAGVGVNSDLLGVPLDADKYTIDRNATRWYELTQILRREEVVEATMEANNFLSRVQDFQDDGLAWGESYDAAVALEERRHLEGYDEHGIFPPPLPTTGDL